VTHGALFLAVFLACVVEAVEATTIVLAAGTARSWRSAASGLVVALAVLAGVIAILGPAVSALPLRGLRLVVGALLLVFGLQWLRKAILRASGLKAVHDERQIFADGVETARAAPRSPGSAGGFVTDWYAFTLAFKGVLLEGLEVVFIVLTFGTNDHDVGLAVIAAIAAVVVVACIGLAVRVPLARVPENSMKFVVGIMLTAFGTFWGVEGAGGSWPGHDVSVAVVIAGVAVLGLLLVAVLRRTGAREAEPAAELSMAGPR